MSEADAPPIEEAENVPDPLLAATKALDDLNTKATVPMIRAALKTVPDALRSLDADLEQADARSRKIADLGPLEARVETLERMTAEVPEWMEATDAQLDKLEQATGISPDAPPAIAVDASSRQALLELSKRLEPLEAALPAYLNAQGATGRLYAALAAARDRIAPIEKGSSATVRMKSGGSFSFNYASAEDTFLGATLALEGSEVSIVPLGFAMEAIGNDGRLWIIRRKFRVGHSSGEHVDAVQDWPVVLGGGGRTLDKAVGAASTGGLAYFVRDLLLIPRGASDDMNTNRRGDGDERGAVHDGIASDLIPEIPRSSTPPAGTLSAAARNLLKRLEAITTPDQIDAAEAHVSKIEDAAGRGAAVPFSDHELKQFRETLARRTDEVNSLLQAWEDTETTPAGDAKDTKKGDEVANGGAANPGRTRGPRRRSPPAGFEE